MFMKEKIEKLKSSQGNGESKEIQEPANGTGTAKRKSGLAREGIAYLLFGVLTTVIDYVISNLLYYIWKMDPVPAQTIAWVAAVLFIIAASTDKIDGWMARKYNQVTEMGKLMDPIADKLLTCGAMIVCSAFGELAWWVTILFLIREIGITVMRFFVMERPGGKVIAAAWPGKLKTVFECVGLAMLLLPMWSLGSGQSTPFWMTAYYFLTYAIIYVALVLCLYSGVIYLYNTFVGIKKQ